MDLLGYLLQNQFMFLDKFFKVYHGFLIFLSEKMASLDDLRIGGAHMYAANKKILGRISSKKIYRTLLEYLF